MIYAVGSGRCGTKSYADQMGGLHEPHREFGSMAISYYLSGEETPELAEKIKARAEMDVPCISDNKQSY